MIVPLWVLGGSIRDVHDWCGRSRRRRRKVSQIRVSLVGALGFGLGALGSSRDREGRRRRGLVMGLRRGEGVVGWLEGSRSRIEIGESVIRAVLLG